MIQPTCLHCKCKFEPNKYHVSDQEYCTKPACKMASHNASNKKWREGEKQNNPLQESNRKQRRRRKEKFRIQLELSRWSKQLAQCQRLLVGMLSLLGGQPEPELKKTISRCLEIGYEVLQDNLIPLENFA